MTMPSARATVALAILGQKSNICTKFSFLAILKISCKNIEKCGGVGKNVKTIFAKLRTQILTILWSFGGFYGTKWLNLMQFS